MIKTFRGLISDEGQAQVRLSTKKGKIGYRIVKFNIMTNVPHTAGTDTEHIVMVWKTVRTTAELGDTTTTSPNFADGHLLAVGLSVNDVTGSGHGYWDTIMFDQEIFNQDIYITNRDTGGSTIACNFYLELEIINLSDNAATVSTLRDIRLNPQVGA
jgi:ERCC4-type nuclease